MSIWDVLFPRVCVGCGGFGAYVCSNCVNRIRTAEQVCPMCGKGSMWGVVHARCKKAWGMDGLIRVARYDSLVRRIVTRVKYKYVSDMVDTLVEMVVVPVPLHKSRQRQRGFNQAGEIGRRVASNFGFRYEDALVRIRNTKPQVKMESRKERLGNVRGAFGVSNKLQVTGNKILLVDDVWTSGATMRECGKVLKRAGAGEVWGLVVEGG